MKTIRHYTKDLINRSYKKTNYPQIAEASVESSLRLPKVMIVYTKGGICYRSMRPQINIVLQK